MSHGVGTVAAMAERDRLTSPLAVLQQDPQGRSLGLDLPPGRLIRETEGGTVDEPILWISDTRPEPGSWPSLRAAYERTGLWPLLLEGLSGNEPDRPWTSGELDPSLIKSRPDDHDPAELLAGWWADHTAPDEDYDTLSGAGRLAVTAPFEDRWPGLAAAGAMQEDPDAHAAEFAEHLLTDAWLTAPRLGLSASTRSADTPGHLGWSGPLNYESDTAKFCSVLRSWEERFGARVVAIGFDTLYLSIAAPPTNPDHALHVAAEHLAFCPDNILQSDTDTLTAYAESITSRPAWSFWWD